MSPCLTPNQTLTHPCLAQLYKKSPVPSSVTEGLTEHLPRSLPLWAIRPVARSRSPGTDGPAKRCDAMLELSLEGRGLLLRFSLRRTT